MKRTLLVVIFALLALPLAGAQSQPAPQYSAKVPPSIQTPDTVQTRIGVLKFFDGLPDEETVKKVYDQLDFKLSKTGWTDFSRRRSHAHTSRNIELDPWRPSIGEFG